MLHDILPTRERMHRMNLPGVPSAVCTLCSDNEEDNSEHALLTCSHIKHLSWSSCGYQEQTRRAVPGPLYELRWSLKFCS